MGTVSLSMILNDTEPQK